MEEDAHNSITSCSNHDDSWCSTTNWTVAYGRLEDSITFESSFSSSVDDDTKKADGSPLDWPLMLFPPSPGPEPCEITITFPQKYEIHQVYVRSTARVYEIYYAPDHRLINDYLCTVRCGIAARDDEVLCTPGVGETALAALKGVGSEHEEKKAKSCNNLKTNEDGWVEVKSSDTPELDNTKGPLPSTFDTKLLRDTQDLYEATAEISDADPCMSITLRLLSLQNKGCVFVDEIYVFADPVEPADSENQVSQMQMGSSAGSSSLMAMFMPTLLQMSKTRSLGQVPAYHSVDTAEEKKSQDIGSEPTELSIAENRCQEEEKSVLDDEQKAKLPEIVGMATFSAEDEMPSQVKRMESNHDVSCSNVKKVLDQLVSRVSRIEDLFLRFEEKMLKPIGSIEVRLQKVEEQLQELNKKTQISESFTRISAPEFSFRESGDDCTHQNANDVVESDSENSHSSKSDDKFDVTSLVEASQSYSSLIITAPEFSSADDEGEKKKQLVATNYTRDIPEEDKLQCQLALAIAGLSDSVSVEPQKYTQALVIKAPDFPVEEDTINDKKAPEEFKDGGACSPICFTATDETDFVNDLVSTSAIGFCLDNENAVDDHPEEAGGNNIYLDTETGKTNSLETHLTVMPAEQDVGETSSCSVGEDTESIEALIRVSQPCVSDDCETVNQFLESRTENDSNTSQEGLINSGSDDNTTDGMKESEKDVLQNFLELSGTHSAVNFETSILDVKFDSQEHSNVKSPLEALLGSDVKESDVKESDSDEVNDGGCSQIDQPGNLISVGDEEPTNPVSGNHFSLDMDYCSLREMPFNMDDKKPQGADSSNTPICTESLI